MQVEIKQANQPQPDLKQQPNVTGLLGRALHVLSSL